MHLAFSTTNLYLILISHLLRFAGFSGAGAPNKPSPADDIDWRDDPTESRPAAELRPPPFASRVTRIFGFFAQRGMCRSAACELKVRPHVGHFT